ncbi:fasciclin domain-containing protein [Sphingobacterium sp. HJSM2_6]|uniref:fasciclin domain-containing protein n=1 Tax=Sphingobacterium sp. HJSM2_6 TaxID=3366264 RepID=UPI003BE97B67
MKINTSYFYFLLLVIFGSCAKDKGYFDQSVQKIKFDGTIAEYLASKPGVFDSLIKVLERTENIGILKDSSNLTFFAPTNQNFQIAIENLNNTRREADKPLEYLSNVELKQLDTMISNYIIRGAFLSDSMEFKDGLRIFDFKYGRRMNAKLVNANSAGFLEGGPKIIEFADTKNSQFNRNWVTANTSSINIEAKNGIIHVINTSHVFGFNDFVTRLTYIPPPPNLFKVVGGVFTTSREHSNGPNAVEASKYVFDGNAETKFLLGDFGSAWMNAELNEPSISNAYTLTSANDAPERDPADWIIQGSNDGSNWTTLDSRAGEQFTGRFQQRVFWINNTVPYKHYRLTVLRLRNGNLFQLADWSMNYKSND